LLPITVDPGNVTGFRAYVAIQHQKTLGTYLRRFDGLVGEIPGELFDSSPLSMKNPTVIADHNSGVAISC
jgi:hypothetical protein